jgi:hypothetical protein
MLLDGVEYFMTRLTVCPQCRGSFEGSQHCPRCGEGKLHSASIWQRELARTVSSGPEKWQQTFGGRLVIGLLLALGLCYGLLQMGMASLRALGTDAASGGLDPRLGLALFQGLQGLALLTGGILAGAGQPRGAVLGGTVGILSGLVFLAGIFSGLVTTLVQSYSGELLAQGSSLHNMMMYVLPLQHALAGAVGGLIGCLIWKPLPSLTLPGLAGIQKRAPGQREISLEFIFRWKGPVAWFRVLVGSIVAIAGAINTPKVVDFILFASDDKLKLVTQLENQVAHGEVFGFAILFGGFLAGMNRSNGLKQGVCVSVIVACAMAAAFLRGAAAPMGSTIFPVLSALLLASVGGWFGSELWPPAFRRSQLKKSPII